MRSSSAMSESSTRCVIGGNMEASHRRVAAPVGNMEVSHRRVAAPVANIRQRACHGGALAVKTGVEAAEDLRGGEEAAVVRQAKPKPKV